MNEKKPEAAAQRRHVGRLDPRQPLAPARIAPINVKIIGLGGVGGIVARYLGLFLGSLNEPSRLILIDGDTFEAGNDSRMHFDRYANKAIVVREGLLQQLSESVVELSAVPEYVTTENLDRLVHERDVVLLCVDNHATRKLVNDFCAARLEDVCLISGGNDGAGADSAGRLLRGTYGNCQIYVRRAGEDATPSLTRSHPEIGSPADRLPTDQSCTDLVASVPQVLFVNLQVAASMLSTLWLYWCDETHYGEVTFDIADALMRPLPLPAESRRKVSRSPST